MCLDQLGCSKSRLFPLLQGTSYRETVQHSRCGCESTAFQATSNSVVEQRVVTCYAVGMCHISEPFLTPLGRPWLTTRLHARLFILLIPGCARCNSCNTSCRHCGGITTLAPHTTQPSCSLNTSLLQCHGAIFGKWKPTGTA